MDVPVGSTDQIRSDRLAEVLGLGSPRSLDGNTLVMEGAAGFLRISAGKRDAQVRGVRVFLGDPVVSSSGALYLSRTDTERLLMPIFLSTGVREAGPIRTIALDAGHGGHDFGTMNPRLDLREKALTLKVVRQLEAALLRRGFEVIMTRDDDVYVPLGQRAERARGADLFISIHFNATTRGDVSGTETYILTPAGQVSTGTHLPHEGEAAPAPGNRWDAPSAALGFIVQRGLLSEFGTVDRGLKHARFAVLRHLPCPGVLVETAFLSNDAEAARVATGSFQAALAESLAGAVEAFAEIAGGGVR